jgi:hypothetical protein
MAVSAWTSGSAAFARARPSTFEPTDLSWQQAVLPPGSAGSAARGQKMSGFDLKLNQNERATLPAKPWDGVLIIQDRERISEALTINVYSSSCA